MAAKMDQTVLGKAIRKKRLERGLTLQELAGRIGVHFTTVSAWERGRSMPGFDIMPKLAGALGTDPQALFGGIWKLTTPEGDSSTHLPPISARAWNEFRRSIESLRFSLAIDRARGTIPMPREEIASRTGLDISRVEDLLNGQAEPSLSEALAISSVVGLRVLPTGSGIPEESETALSIDRNSVQVFDQLRNALNALPEVPRNRILGLWVRVLDWIDHPRKKG